MVADPVRAKRTTWVRHDRPDTISAAMAIFLSWILCASLLSGNNIGTLYTTLVLRPRRLRGAIRHRHRAGVPVFAADLGQEFLPGDLFFIPLMITPLGVGYAMRMVADVTKGPFEPILRISGAQRLGLVGRRLVGTVHVMMIGDSWQWIPFIFICMLAALENIPRDHVEAAQVDGASSFQIFREITWPQVVPVAVTVLADPR